jgi:hypothetical protein
MQHGRLGNAYSVLVRNPERKILLGTRRRSREDIKMDLKQDGRGSDWIGDKRWAAVNKAMNFGFHPMQRILSLAAAPVRLQERRCSMYRAAASSCLIQLLSTPSPRRRENCPLAGTRLLLLLQTPENSGRGQLFKISVS